MTDPTNSSPRTPQSSSAWGPSGTSALSVTIENPSARPQPAPAGSEVAPEPHAPEPQAHAAPPQAPIEAAGEIPAPPHALEPVQAVAAETAQPIPDAPATTAAAGGDIRDHAATLFDQVSRNVKLAFSDAGSDAALITFTLLEFAQASARNNYQLAQDYAAARSVPDIVNVQAAYFRRQMEFMNRQASELRKAAAEIASKKAARIQAQAIRQPHG